MCVFMVSTDRCHFSSARTCCPELFRQLLVPLAVWELQPPTGAHCGSAGQATHVATRTMSRLILSCCCNVSMLRMAVCNTLAEPVQSCHGLSA